MCSVAEEVWFDTVVIMLVRVGMICAEMLPACLKSCIRLVLTSPAGQSTLGTSHFLVYCPAFNSGITSLLCQTTFSGPYQDQVDTPYANRVPETTTLDMLLKSNYGRFDLADKRGRRIIGT
jgi:hypothetical protein